MSTMTGEAAGNREPMTTQHISAAQRTRMRVRHVSGGKPNRGVGLFCCRIMLSINCRLFRLGALDQTYARVPAARPTVLQNGLQLLPLHSIDAGIAKNPGQKAGADVSSVGFGTRMVCRPFCMSWCLPPA